jgi:hypothetical protein
MKIFRSAFAVVALCLLCLAADAQVLKRTTVKTDSIPFGAGSTLAIAGAPVGNVKVSNSTTDKITIEATIEVQAATEADLAGAAALTGFVVQETLGRVAIVSVGADSRRKFTNDEKKLIKRLKGMPYRIDYQIGIPKYCNVEIDGGRGEIQLVGADGRHRITGVDAEVSAHVSGFLSIALQKGKADIQVVPTWRMDGIEASVVAGDISLRVAHGVSANLDASVLRGGKIVTNDGLKLIPRDERKFPFTEKVVSGKLGSGGSGIKLTVGDGNIWLLPLVE